MLIKQKRIELFLKLTPVVVAAAVVVAIVVVVKEEMLK